MGSEWLHEKCLLSGTVRNNVRGWVQEARLVTIVMVLVPRKMDEGVFEGYLLLSEKSFFICGLQLDSLEKKLASAGRKASRAVTETG